MANDTRNTNQFCAAERAKLELNAGAQGQTYDGKQAHANIADIDAQGIDLRWIP